MKNVQKKGDSAQTPHGVTDLTSQVVAEIKHYVELSSRPDLVNRVDDLPDDEIDAIYNMICDQEFNKVPKTMIAFHVLHDVQVIECGLNDVLFCVAFLNDGQ